MFTIHEAVIDFTDGTTDKHTTVTRGDNINPGIVVDGVLHLYTQNGEYAVREHVASYPLVNIKRYRFIPR